MTGGQPPARTWAGIVIPVLAGVLVFVLHTRLIHFPFWYHWDEESKSLQILEENRNFRHPLLMLHAADLLHRLQGRPAGLQETTEIGRVVTSGFTAATVAVLARLAHVLVGPAAAACTGLLVGLLPELVHHGHYFKEDPGLLLGWAQVWWALAAYRARPGRRAAFLCGLAIACCASGKHVGWLALPVSLGAIAWWGRSPGARRGWHVGLALLVSLAAWVTINHAMLLGWPIMRGELHREMRHLLYERSVETNALRIFATLLPAACWAGLGFYGWRLWRNRGPRGIEGVALVMAVLYLLLLLGTTRLARYYLLPLWMTAAWLAALGLGNWAEGVTTARWRGWRLVVAGVAPLLVLVLAANRAVPACRLAVGPDHRLELARFLHDELPLAAVAYDLGVNLPDPRLRERDVNGWTPRTWVAPLYCLDLLPGPDPLDALVAQGFSHVAICGGVAMRFDAYRNPKQQPAVLFSDEALRPAFYDALRARATCVWHRQGIRGRLLQPTLELFQLPAAEGSCRK